MTNHSEEWTTVTKSDKKRLFRQRKRNDGANKTHQWQVDQGSHGVSTEASRMSLDELEKVTAQCQNELVPTKFFLGLQDALRQGPPPTNIVCYGLGNFGLKQSEPSASMWQLACILQLWESWKKEGKDIPMHYFEPFSLPEEVAFLENRSIDVIKENEKGRRLVREPTFFFMPHCPLGLYSNLLYTNRKCLENVLILGNSLTSYANRLEQNCSTRLLRHVQPFWHEIPVETPCNEISSLPGHFERGFNDSAVVYFTGGNDLDLPVALSEELIRMQDDAGEVL